MKHKKWLIFCIAFAMVAGTALALNWSRANQRLGQPGIITAPIPGSVMMTIDLPAKVLDFTSTNVPEPQVVLNYLPPDTSYAERCYYDINGSPIYATVVLMGGDRTSIHNADYCLTGQGFSGKEKSVANIMIADAHPYQLPVARWNISGKFQTTDGKQVEVHGIYVFWFVAEGQQTPDHFDFMKKTALHLLATGVLQRWAYISYFAVCAPGQEEATFEQMKGLIAHSVPEFQKPPAGH